MSFSIYTMKMTFIYVNHNVTYCTNFFFLIFSIIFLKNTILTHDKKI